MARLKRVFTTTTRLLRRNRAVLTTIAAVGAMVLFKTGAAHAGTDVTFEDLNTLIENWTKGSLGKALSLIALVLGIGIAAARQSFAALFAGVGVAAGASIGPGVINQVITGIF